MAAWLGASCAMVSHVCVRVCVFKLLYVYRTRERNARHLRSLPVLTRLCDSQDVQLGYAPQHLVALGQAGEHKVWHRDSAFTVAPACHRRIRATPTRAQGKVTIAKVGVGAVLVPAGGMRERGVESGRVDAGEDGPGGGQRKKRAEK